MQKDNRQENTEEEEDAETATQKEAQTVKNDPELYEYAAYARSEGSTEKCNSQTY